MPIITESPADTAAAILAGDASPAIAMNRSDLFPFFATAPMLGTSAKIDAGKGIGVLTSVLYMMPAGASGREACAGRSAGCTDACLAEGTGRMSMRPAQRARRRRHAAFYADRAAFLRQLDEEIDKLARKADRLGMIPAVRLNGTTDLPWHRMPFTREDGTRFPNLHAAHPYVQFYEYTKLPHAKATRGGIPANLSLTFSLSDHPDSDARAAEWLNEGRNVAAVLRIEKHATPDTFTIGGTAYPTVDGDAHDARFVDPAGHIVVLAAKGRAKGDTTGFVRDPN